MLPRRIVAGEPCKKPCELESVADPEVEPVLSRPDLLRHAADVAADDRPSMSQSFLDPDVVHFHHYPNLGIEFIPAARRHKSEIYLVIGLVALKICTYIAAFHRLLAKSAARLQFAGPYARQDPSRPGLFGGVEPNSADDPQRQ